MSRDPKNKRRATVLVMIVGLLATLFLIVTAYITLARFNKLTAASVQKSQTVEDVLGTVHNVVLSSLREAWSDGNGNLLTGGRRDPNDPNTPVLDTYSGSDIPGYRGTSFLSQTEPVRDRVHSTDPNYNDLQLFKQTVSSFGAPAKWSRANLPIHPYFPDPNGLVLREDPNLNLNNTAIRNARQPFMDADGDGIPDSAFVGMAHLTELANAVAGVVVRAPVDAGDKTTPFYFRPSDIGDPSDPNLTPYIALARQWRRFTDQARFEVAVKVISNGGLVALASPGDATSGLVWNREFVTQMFNWTRYLGGMSQADPPMYFDSAANTLLNRLSASAAQVEPYLRYRGGLLTVYPLDDAATGVFAPTPPVLTDLRNLYPGTFRGTPTNWKPDRTQRFNLASAATANPGEWNAWRTGTTLDPDVFNAQWPTTYALPLQGSNYVRQHLMTTISNSDDLALKTDSSRPSYDPNVIDKDMGLYPGQLKFYLGDISQVFSVDPNDGMLKYNVDDIDPNTGTRYGNRLVRQLANYYYEMLREYDGWQDWNYDPNSPVPLKTEAVSLRDQAFMLAVNTAAAAAPRTADPLNSSVGGFIDTVWYYDAKEPNHARWYTGYAPQPFITQVVAHCEGGDPNAAGIGLAIELFNPQDFAPGADPTAKFESSAGFGDGDYALDLNQFAISVNRPTELPVLYPLNTVVGGRSRLTGRNYIAFYLDQNNNDTLYNAAVSHVDGSVRTVAVNTYDDPAAGASKRRISVRLWRRGSSGAWRLCDMLLVGDDGTHPIPSLNAQGKELIWLVDYYRDSKYCPQFRWDTDNDLAYTSIDRPARWRVVTDVHHGFEDDTDPDEDPNDPGPGVDTHVNNLNNDGETSGLTLSPFAAPTVPLCTPNPRPGLTGSPNAMAPWNKTLRRDFFGTQPVNGVYRPKAFPTVGFLMFVPRFSHTSSWPMSTTLARQWLQAGPSGRPGYTPTAGRYPADFGHMWIFDNHQDVKNWSSMDGKEAGRIPWGLRIYDYFTDIDPRADYDGDGRYDIDPLRIPSRINFNTAPWYVLAGVPLLRLSTQNYVGDIDRTLSPAFWSTQSGVFVADTGGITFPNSSTSIQRFDPNETGLYWDPSVGGAGGWRLGPYLAQAAAAYRDRIRYYTDGPSSADPKYNPFTAADMRNSPTAGFFEYRYRKEADSDPIFLQGYSYAAIRRSASTLSAPVPRGFLSLGELLNVNGFVPNKRYAPNAYWPLGVGPNETAPTDLPPDFFKAVSLMALLDTQFLTTRSNTFTVYVSVTDKQNPQSSIRSQLTVDRSNLLPKLALDANGLPLLERVDNDPNHVVPIVTRNDGLPEIVTERHIGYYNTQFDH